MTTDVLVIGGSAAGIVAAITAKDRHPEKNVKIIRKESKVMVPCGIPYIFGSLKNSEQNVIQDKMLLDKGIEIIVDEVVAIDKKYSTCITKSNGIINYDRLIFATGSTPRVPKWLKGYDLENVFVVPKNKNYIDNFHKNLDNKEKIVVVGGGFIGVEVADELHKAGKDVTIVEMLPHVLGAVFDDDVALKAQEVLVSRGIKIKSGVGIKSINGEKSVSSVTLANDEVIDADVVILSMGYAPNTTLAKETDLEVNEFDQIVVDEYRRSGFENIFAAGDCAQKKDFITGKRTPIMLASIASFEGKTAGLNLYGIATTKNISGTVPIFSTAIGNDAFATAGYTKKAAKKENLNIITASFDGIDKHPATIYGTKALSVELVVMKNSGRIIGGTLSGGNSVGELVNVLGFAVQSRMTVHELYVMQVATHPMLTGSPVAHPLIKAAEIAAKQLS
jgi:NADPH-dependent 2,4-dienoyl-CoA reductase/sulfur reductase-like enzyme